MNEVKLKFSVEGGQVVSASIDGVTTRLDKFDQGARAASVGTGTLKQEMSALHMISNTVIGSLGSIAGGLSVVAVAAKAISVQREFDILNSSLITVTGSSMKAAQEFEWIKRFAATTPYQLNEVTGAFVKMKALGLDASEKALTSYGNTASAMGKGINQMIEAVADASTGEFERLKEFGIKAKQNGDQVSLTFQGVTTSIGNNAAEITKYLQNIGNVEFSGAMEERAKTLDGQLSNLADNWDALFRTVNQGGFGAAVTNDVKVINAALQGMNDTMLNSQKASDSMINQIANAAGFAVGTAAVGAFNATVSGVNWTVNALTGNLFNLNENFKRLPESLMTNEQRASMLGGKLQEAEANLATLQAKLSLVPDNIYLKDSTYQAFLLAKELRSAKEAQDKLTSGSQKSQSETRVKASNALSDQVAKDNAAVSDLLTKLSGVPKDYIDTMRKIGELHASGALVGDAYAKALDGARGMLKKGSTTVSEAAKGLALYNDLTAKAVGVNANYTEEQNKLTAAYKSHDLTLAQYQEANALLIAQQPYMLAQHKAEAEAIKVSTHAAQARADQRNKEYAGIDQYFADQQARHVAEIKAIDAHIDSVNSDAAAQDLSRQANISLAQAVETLTLRRLEERAARLNPGKELAALNAEIAKRRELLGVIVGRDVVAQGQKTSDAIQASLTDAFMNAIDNGKSLFVNLRDAVVGMFKNMVLRPIIQGVMAPVATAISGSMLGTSANAASGASGASGMLGTGGQLAQLGAFGGEFGAGMSAAFSNGLIDGFASNMAIATQSGSLGASLGAAMPYIGAALAAYAVLDNLGAFGSKFTSTSATGTANSTYGSNGTMLATTTSAGSAAQMAGQQSAVESLARSYFDTAAALGIKAMQATFEVGGNTGREGKDPQTVLGVNVGSTGYSSGTLSAGDAAGLQLAASRAVLTALQASDLPGYLVQVFDGITASSASQDQINNTLAYAQALKTQRDSLLETRTAQQILQDAVSAGVVSLGTSAASFKSDFVAAIDAGLSPENLAKWQALGTSLDRLAADAQSAASALANTNRVWQDKLDVLMGSQTQRSIALRDAGDDSTRALMRQVYAQEDLAAAAQATAQASGSAAQAAESLRDAWQSTTTGLLSEVARIRGVMGDATAQTYAQSQTAFAVATAQARAGDQTAAAALPALSQTLLTLAEAQATSLTELRRMQGRTAASLGATASVLGAQFGLPSFDVGLNSVPFDMVAKVHKDERIMPAADNRELMARLAMPAQHHNNDDVVAELRAVRQELAELKALQRDGNANHKRTADTLVQVTRGGESMLAEVVA